MLRGLELYCTGGLGLRLSGVGNYIGVWFG